MNSVYRCKISILALMLVGFASSMGWALDPKPLTPSDIENFLRNDVYARLNAARANPPTVDADNAFRLVNFAIGYIPNGPAKAKASLGRALAALTRVRQNPADQKFMTIYHDAQIADSFINVEEARVMSRQASALLAKGDFQQARSVLQSMASEIRIVTMKVPVANFTAAAQKAADILKNNGDTGEARRTLLAAVQTLVRDEGSIPLPLVRAQAALNLFAQAKAKDRLGPQDEKLLLAEASRQLALAKALGYVPETAPLKAVETQVKAVEVANGSPAQISILNELQTRINNASQESAKTVGITNQGKISIAQ